jgi:hypothetical protein
VTEKFGMSSLFERFSLWKEIHLDTPIRIRRLASKA